MGWLIGHYTGYQPGGVGGWLSPPLRRSEVHFPIYTDEFHPYFFGALLTGYGMKEHAPKKKYPVRGPALPHSRGFFLQARGVLFPKAWFCSLVADLFTQS